MTSSSRYVSSGCVRSGSLSSLSNRSSQAASYVSPMPQCPALRITKVPNVDVSGSVRVTRIVSLPLVVSDVIATPPLSAHPMGMARTIQDKTGRKKDRPGRRCRADGDDLATWQHVGLVVRCGRPCSTAIQGPEGRRLGAGAATRAAIEAGRPSRAARAQIKRSRGQGGKR